MKKAVNIDQGQYAIFEDNLFKKTVNLNELYSIKEQLEDINNSLDIYDNDELLLQWAKQNFYLYGDGQFIRQNQIKIAEILELIDLIGGE